MDNNRLLYKFSKLRKKPQQPLMDLTELYSQIANETILYLRLEEKNETKRALQGWKSLNTHVLYQLTQIERNYPNIQIYTKDEQSLHTGIKDLYHKSLNHLERVQKLNQENLVHASGSDSKFTSRSNKPVGHIKATRIKFKTLREPGMQYHNKNNNIIKVPNDVRTRVLSAPPNTSNFEGFDEEINLIDLSDHDDISRHNLFNKQRNSISDLEFNIDDYFDDFIDLSDDELQQSKTVNKSEDIRFQVNKLSLETPVLQPLKNTLVSAQEYPKKNRPIPKKILTPLPKPTTEKFIQRGESGNDKIRSKVVTTDRNIMSQKDQHHTTKNKNDIRRTNIRQVKSTDSRRKTIGVSQKSGESKKKVTNSIVTKSASIPSSAKLYEKPTNKNPKNITNLATEESQHDHSKNLKVSSQNDSQLKEYLEDEIIESLIGVDKPAAKQIFSEIVVHGDEVHWDDIAGLESAKTSLKEAVVYPFLRPDLFKGLREPVRGMLLFGPPGTGKTMLARAVATESRSTFFSISASSLTSKYLGESEKLVRALFTIAKKLSPSVIFVDEIDSIMGNRNNEGENESSRRIKNEFLIQWSSLSTAAVGNNNDQDDERVLVLAATNLPWSIDEAARRRFVRRQYIPLPEPNTRKLQFTKLLQHQKHTLSETDISELLDLTDGFSGSDITSLAKDAAMGPLRELGDKLLFTSRDHIRPINLDDFKNSMKYIKPSISKGSLQQYEDWSEQFGSSGV